MINKLIEQHPTGEIDTMQLMHWLSGYSKPRDAISRLVREGVITRVKQGLYVFGNGYGKLPYSPEILANMIYGPSYISFEYALSFYGLIPERVSHIVSVTPKRNKIFQTPIGLFKYRYQSLSKYISGLTRVPLDSDRGVLMASPEKALIDCLLRDERQLGGDISVILEQDYRILVDCISQFRLLHLKKMNQLFRSKLIGSLIQFIKDNR